MYPNAGQKLALDQVVDSHRELYNAALEERIDAYRKHKISISSYYDQCKSLTDIRAFDKKYAAINAQSLQVTLKRLDLAFQSFFRRARQNQSARFSPISLERSFSMASVSNLTETASSSSPDLTGLTAQSASR
jgi:putative transposase